MASITLKDEKIVGERWAVLIENGQGKAGQIYKDTEKYIRETNAPGVEVEMVKAKTSWLKGLFGGERDYMLVTTESLKDFRVLIGARDYGNNLDVHAFTTCEPGYFKKSFSSALSGGDEKALSYALDIFQQQDLSAFRTVVYGCLDKAANTLTQSLNQDLSKIQQKQKGFLGI
ncbi:MAG: hypothetical protein PHP03_00385 [Candidatus Pacebacteria bacterium]|nr:hypothetical protein [Candidatus Paceibacterota bacterium]